MFSLWFTLKEKKLQNQRRLKLGFILKEKKELLQKQRKLKLGFEEGTLNPMAGQKWGCDFPKELIIKIAEEHLDSYDDFERLRWICSRWREAAKKAIFGHPSHPLLILPDNNRTRQNLHLYNLSTLVIRHVDIPKDIVDRYRRAKVVSSSNGWLLLLAELPDSTIDLFLFNPFSAAVIKLPTFDSDDSVTENIRKFVLSANPCTASEFSVYLMFAPETEVTPPTSSFFWRKGDNSWTLVDTGSLDVARLITYYDGAFYKIDRHGTVSKVDSFTGQIQVMCKLPAQKFLNFGRDLLYLVKLDGQLVVIKRVRQKVEHKMRTVRLMRTVRFELFELDLSSEEVEQMQFPSLGNAAVFIDSTDSFTLQDAPSVHVCDGFNVKPNCIYYTDDRYVRGDPNIMGLYNLSNGEREDFYNGPSITDCPFFPDEESKISYFAQLMWVQCHRS